MGPLNKLERSVLEMLLAGEDQQLGVLRRQLEFVAVAQREATGVGFYCTLQVPADAPRLHEAHDFEIGDVIAEIDELKHGAGFVLFVKNGRLDMLEGYTFDEAWPAHVGEYSLRYSAQPRDLPKVG